MDRSALLLDGQFCSSRHCGRIQQLPIRESKCSIILQSLCIVIGKLASEFEEVINIHTDSTQF